MYVFSGPEKIIYLDNGVTSFEVKDLYSNWKQWILSGANSRFLPAFSTIGGDPISSTKNVAPYYFITNGWRIRPFEAGHQLNIEGNLFVEGGAGNPFIPTTGNHNVFINISTSNNSIVINNTVAPESSVTGSLNNIRQKIDDLTALSL